MSTDDREHGPPQEVWDAWARECRCCPECSPTICEGVMQGAPCDQRCHCRDDEPADDDVECHIEGLSPDTARNFESVFRDYDATFRALAKR